MTAPDPRLDAIQVRLDAATLGLWEHFPITGKWSGVRVAGKAGYAELDPHDAAFIANAPADVAYLLAELRAARATNERLNRRAQVAEAALNAVTSEGRAGIREDKLLHEYWQRAEDARAELRKAHAALARVEELCANTDDTAVTVADGAHIPVHLIRAAVAAANGDGA